MQSNLPPWFTDPSLKRVEHFGDAKVSTSVAPKALDVALAAARKERADRRYIARTNKREAIRSLKAKRAQEAARIETANRTGRLDAAAELALQKSLEFQKGIENMPSPPPINVKGKRKNKNRLAADLRKTDRLARPVPKHIPTNLGLQQQARSRLPKGTPCPPLEGEG